MYIPRSQFSQHLVDSTKFDLFYDVWVERSILGGLGDFGTRISFGTYSNHSYGFWAYEAKEAIF